MLKLNARISSIVCGLLLLTALQGCALRTREVLVDKPVPVAVVVKDTPPAELAHCASRPDGLPEDGTILVQIPTQVRAGIIRLARAFAANASQLDRLIDWSIPGTCAMPKAVK